MNPQRMQHFHFWPFFPVDRSDWRVRRLDGVNEAGVA